MKTKINSQPVDFDEVERCRQVRRTLERTHGGLKGLSKWLKALEKQRQRKPPRGGKPKQGARDRGRKSQSQD